MTRRALVIGSQVDGLSGVIHDTESMVALLEARGFEIDLRLGSEANRRGILEGYDQLTARSVAGDAAVIYYSGHGVYQTVAAERGSWQSIVPTDYRESRPSDWRGITAWELSVLQVGLTKKTENVTVILDCCHSSQMSRFGAIARALPHPVHAGFTEHLDSLRAMHGKNFEEIHGLGNPHAVRLVACGQTESAYEYAAQGSYRGAFTEALVDVLHQVGDAPVSWQAISEAIRLRVLARFPLQRPAVEGPARRKPFSHTEVAMTSGVEIRIDGDKVRLAEGLLTGVCHNDIYAVMPAGSLIYNGSPLAELEVVEVSALTALAHQRTGPRPLPADAIAFPLRRGSAKRAVALEVPVEHRRLVEAEFAKHQSLRVATADDVPIATLRLVDRVLVVDDACGRARRPMQFPTDLRVAFEAIVSLGVAQGLRELDGEHGVAATELGLELGIVEDGHLRRLRDHGSAFGLGEKLYVRIANRSHRGLFVHVFNICADAEIQLMTHFARTGWLLDRRAPALVLGQAATGANVGVSLSWPRALDPTIPGLEEIVVVATLRRTNLAALETGEGAVAHSRGNQPQNPLGLLRDGLCRTVSADAAQNGFLLRRLSYLLCPHDSIPEEMKPHRTRRFDDESCAPDDLIDAR